MLDDRYDMEKLAKAGRDAQRKRERAQKHICGMCGSSNLVFSDKRDELTGWISQIGQCSDCGKSFPSSLFHHNPNPPSRKSETRVCNQCGVAYFQEHS